VGRGRCPWKTALDVVQTWILESHCSMSGDPKSVSVIRIHLIYTVDHNRLPSASEMTYENLYFTIQ